MVVGRVEVQVQIVIGFDRVVCELAEFFSQEVIIHSFPVLAWLSPFLKLVSEKARTVFVDLRNCCLIMEKEIENALMQMFDSLNIDP